MPEARILLGICIVILILIVFVGTGARHHHKHIAKVAAENAATTTVVETTPTPLVAVPASADTSSASMVYDPSKPAPETFIDANGIQQSFMYYYNGYDPCLSGCGQGKERLINPVQVVVDAAKGIKLGKGKVKTKTLTFDEQIAAVDPKVWVTRSSREQLADYNCQRVPRNDRERAACSVRKTEHLVSPKLKQLSADPIVKAFDTIRLEQLNNCDRVPRNDRERAACSLRKTEHLADYNCNRTPRNDRERAACSVRKTEHLVNNCNVSLSDIVSPTCKEGFEVGSVWSDIKNGATSMVAKGKVMLGMKEHLSYDECLRLGVRNPLACKGSPLNPEHMTLKSEFSGLYVIKASDGRALTVVGSRAYGGPDPSGTNVALLEDQSAIPGSMQLWTIRASATQGYIIESRNHRAGAMALTLGEDGNACVAPSYDLPAQRFNIPSPFTPGMKQVKLVDGRCMQPDFGGLSGLVSFGDCSVSPGWSIVSFKPPF